MLVRISRVIRCSYRDTVLTCKCYKEINMPIPPVVGMRVFVGWESPYIIQGICYDADHDILWASIGVQDYDESTCEYESLEDCTHFFKSNIDDIDSGTSWTPETKDDLVWWFDEHYGDSEIGFTE